MHSGRFKTLRESVAFYTKGRGHAVPAGVEMQLHWHIWESDLTEDELDRIVDFLLTLTDETFMPITPISVPSGLTPLNNPTDHPAELSHSTIKLKQEERSLA
ncbi:MAG: cytochrome c peroxidase [Flavobacteriales bacterium]|jgi:cytochrome c peroxidase